MQVQHFLVELVDTAGDGENIVAVLPDLGPVPEGLDLAVVLQIVVEGHGRDCGRRPETEGQHTTGSLLERTVGQQATSSPQKTGSLEGLETKKKIIEKSTDIAAACMRFAPDHN